MRARDACRLFRHKWDIVSGDWTPKGLGTPVTLVCERCTTEKREVYGTNTGELVSRRYIYPPDYHYAHDDRPSADELRLLWVREQVAELRKARQRA